MVFNVPKDKVKEVAIHFVNGDFSVYDLERVNFEIHENGVLIYTENANTITFHPFSTVLRVEFRGEEEEKGENKVGD